MQRIEELKTKAAWVRGQILKMIVSAGRGHIGGAFSCADILVALYYSGALRLRASSPRWQGRDRFILSKGHSATALYAILADLGFFSLSQLDKYQQEGLLAGHPHKRIPGVEADTGSLGHGLGIGAGLALSAKMDKKDFLAVVLLGDGECCEGSVWEAAMFAAHHRLGNLTAIIDRNGLCSTDFLKHCLKVDPLEDKWRGFGWDVQVVDGHSFDELLAVFSNLHSRASVKPLAIIADTIKGKGVSFMEGDPEWHHSVPKGEQAEIAEKELRNSCKDEKH